MSDDLPAELLRISDREIFDAIEMRLDQVGLLIALLDFRAGNADDEGAAAIYLGDGRTLVVDADNEAEPDGEDDDASEDDDPPEEHDHGGGDIQDECHDGELDLREGDDLGGYDNGVGDGAALAEVMAELALQAAHPPQSHSDAQATRAAGRQALEELARLRGKPASGDGRQASNLKLLGRTP
jgi:hypothetical protein